jgi:hypothetical protein
MKKGVLVSLSPLTNKTWKVDFFCVASEPDFFLEIQVPMGNLRIREVKAGETPRISVVVALVALFRKIGGPMAQVICGFV